MSHCNIEVYHKCLPEGIDGSITFIAKNNVVDPLGYTAKIGEITIPVTADQQGNDVVIAIPLVNLSLSIGTHGGFFATNTKTEGVFFQFNIRLDIIKNVSL